MYENPPENNAEFENLFVTTLNNLAPKKCVSIRENNKHHMSKKLHNAIMIRSRLKNRANFSRKNVDV